MKSHVFQSHFFSRLKAPITAVPVLYNILGVRKELVADFEAETYATPAKSSKMPQT
jgi:hypothetical protein